MGVLIKFKFNSKAIFMVDHELSIRWMGHFMLYKLGVLRWS